SGGIPPLNVQNPGQDAPARCNARMYRIVVLVDTQKYEFRTDEEGQVVLLRQPLSPFRRLKMKGASMRRNR
ncbi:MAG: hypothetical protein Q9O62_04475, partial [Ardenticatenia bacterium]|nr:hypothetical protein [Ardenticatenia bacterium]